jgi:hypothetical protein
MSFVGVLIFFVVLGVAFGQVEDFGRFVSPLRLGWVVRFLLSRVMEVGRHGCSGMRMCYGIAEGAETVHV